MMKMRRRSPLWAALMLGGSVLALTAEAAGAQERTSSVQTTATRYRIPAQPLSDALLRFAEQSGLQVSADAPAIRNARSAPVEGVMPAAEALQRLLAGSGFNGAIQGRTVSLTPALSAPRAELGVIQLGAVRVEGATSALGAGGTLSGLSDDAVYSEAAPVAHIGADRIERYRGSSPADVFRGTPGVLSGEARNGAGAIDLNIRGLQGFGRVTTKIDGAENAVTVYQGYQGVSNRTFIDPDFIAGVDVTKGADAAAFGNAGSVAIRTLDAGDIVREGETWGLRVRGGLRGNTSNPTAGDRSGYVYRSVLGTAEPSATGMDRPDALEPTSGWGSVVAAFSGEAIDLLAGYTYREQGNFHAGEHGPVARPLNIGDTIVWGGVQPNTMINAGLANYRAGEEVLNSQLQTESWLAKATARFGDGQVVQLGYNAYRSEAGDRLASRQTSREGQALQQAATAGTRLDTYTARYLWAPSDSDLIDLKANAYWSHLELRNPIRGGRLATPKTLGLAENFRVGSDSDLWGVDVSNRSRFFLDSGDLELTYGLSYRGEDTRGSRHTAVLEGWNTPRDGFRHELAGFAKGAYTPRDWLTLNGGLRYTHYWSEDRYDPYEVYQNTPEKQDVRMDDGGFSPTLGLVLRPLEGAQIYVNYSSTLRAPALTETISAFNSFVANKQIQPERSKNWELGANLIRNDLLAQGDRAQFKVGYFHWVVDDYIARNVRTEPTIALNIENIHQARFEGLEFSSRYELGGLTADFAANYYLDIQYCRTADACGQKSLYGDYATNHVPPEYSLELGLSQKLMQERLTLGGRVQHTGPRAIGHGDVTAQGAGQFVALVDWKPYTLTDLFADYRVTDRLTASFRVENLFDRYYMDPLGLVTQPGPGRTVSFSLTQQFGGDRPMSWLSPFSLEPGEVTRDWTGFYLGAHGGGQHGSSSGAASPLNGAVNPNAAREGAKWSAPSGLMGLQAGYNRQLSNNWVMGVETDWSRTYLRDRVKTFSPDQALAERGYLEASREFEVNWTAGVRARLGYAFSDRFMVYGSGGLALAQETQSRDQYVSNSGHISSPLGSETSVFFVERASITRKGFSAGLGAEYALSDRWSVRAEYSYSRFGKQDVSFARARAGTGVNYTSQRQIGVEMYDPSTDPNMAWLCAISAAYCLPYERPVYETVQHAGSSTIEEGRRASSDLELHAIRIGLNFRF